MVDSTSRDQASGNTSVDRSNADHDNDASWHKSGNSRNELSDLPSIQDADGSYQPPANVPSYHGSGEWSGDGYVSALPSYPPSMIPRPVQASRNQAASSLTAQQVTFPLPPRRIPLGPPPSARRGPASYYPPIASVHPIVEESDSGHASARTGPLHSPTSSQVSGPTMGGVPSYYLDEAVTPTSESAMTLPENEPGPHAPSSRPSIGMHNNSHIEPIEHSEESESIALMRQVSLDSTSKPQLTLVPSRDRLRDSTRDKVTTENQKSQEDPSASTPAETEAANSHNSVTNLGSLIAMSKYAKSRDDLSIQSVSSHGNLLSSSKAEGSPEASQKKQNAQTIDRETSKTSLLRDVSSPNSFVSAYSTYSKDPRMQEILSSLEKGGAFEHGKDVPYTTEDGANDISTISVPAGMAERPGRPRPPRLDIAAVRDAEARGSLSSLSDLIRRATRLASNLDRGKTASRLGLNWMTASPTASEKLPQTGDRNSRQSGLDPQYPPPNARLKDVSRGTRKRWSSHPEHSPLGSESDVCSPNRKRWCGIPVWLFLILIVVAILIIAAAIIVPVVLVLIPHQNRGSSVKAPASCRNPLSCENGGTNILSSNGDCQCLCVNGFSGTTCSTADPAGCTTANIGSTTNAAVGSSLPRLISGAQSNFSIPLNGDALLDLFSSVAATCNLENQLVTFSGVSNSKRAENVIEAYAAIEQRDATVSSQGAFTTNGIMVATGSPTIATATATTNSASTPTSTSTASNGTLNSTTTDFAGVTVLYVLQVSGRLDNAVTAQANLQSYFQSPSGVDTQALDLGNGYVCNLNNYAITLANGTVVG